MEAAKEVRTLNLDDILPNRFQPRIKFSEKTIMGLAESIKKHGVIEPIVVRPISDKYEIIAGERRYKASVLAGKTTIPAIITSLDDKNSAEVALIENVQRENLTPIEEAISYRKILDMGYMNQTELALKLGKTQSTVANKLRLLNLEEDVQEALLDEKISERHARSLLRLKGRKQIDMLNRIMQERLTVRATDEAIAKELERQEDDDIEILDFDDDIEGGETVNNQFNIPESPIIENPNNRPVPTPEVVPVAPENFAEAPKTVNPGFMDVDQIVSQAQDIYQPPKQEPSLSSLLRSDKPVEQKVEEPVVQPVEEETSSGKFFNMFRFPEQKEENPNFVENLENKEVNMDFGMSHQTVPPVFNPFEVANEPVAQSNQVASQAIESVPSNSMFDTFVNPTEVAQNVNPAPVSETPTPVVDEVSSTPMPAFNPFEESVNPSPVFTNQVESTPESDFIKPSMNQPIYSLDDDDLFADPEPVAPVERVDTPSSAVPTQPQSSVFNAPNVPEPVTPIYDILDDEPTSYQEQVTNTVVNQPLEQPTVQPINNTVPSAIGTQTVTVSPSQAPSDLRMVINMIRNCADEIERYGYVVDLEELDFENSYQVIFKIEKKN